MAVKHDDLQKKYEQLQAPLKDDEIEWKIGVVLEKDQNRKPKFPSKVMLVPYIKHDVVQRRLNTILGFGNWSLEINRLDPVGNNGITKATLIIHTDERNVILEDIADDNDSGGIKGSATRALPRVVRLLGMGDELYRLPQVWVMAQSAYKHEPAPPIERLRKQGNLDRYDVKTVDENQDDDVDDFEAIQTMQEIIADEAKNVNKLDEYFGEQESTKKQRQQIGITYTEMYGKDGDEKRAEHIGMMTNFTKSSATELTHDEAEDLKRRLATLTMAQQIEDGINRLIKAVKYFDPLASIEDDLFVLSKDDARKVWSTVKTAYDNEVLPKAAGQ